MDTKTYNVPVWVQVRATSPGRAAREVDWFFRNEVIQSYPIEGVDVGYNEEFIEELEEDEGGD